MSRTSDVVIVGGGLNGAATAYHLSRLGAKSVMVLAGSKDDRGASQDAVGLLRTHHDNRPEMALAAASMSFFENWHDEFDEPNGWLASGFIRFIGEEEVESLKFNVALQHEFGIDAQVLTPDEIGAMHPYFDLSGIGAAVYEPDAGTADNWMCTKSLLGAARRQNVDVRQVDAIRILTDAHGICGVIDADGMTVATRTVVLAAGAWARELAATASVELPLESRAISVGEVDLPAQLSRASSYMDPLTDSWLTPRSATRGIITLQDEFTAKPADPDSYSREVRTSVYREGVARVAKRVPSMAGAVVRRSWTRLDTYAPDGKPILGPVDGVDGLYLNVAGAGKGQKVAPAIGQSLSEMILGQSPSIVDLTPFHLSRFGNGGFPVSGAEYQKRTIG